MREDDTTEVVGLVADAETWTDLRLIFFEPECITTDFLFVLVVTVEDAVSSSSLMTVVAAGLLGSGSNGAQLRSSS